jgi:hypothetical protein
MISKHSTYIRQFDVDDPNVGGGKFNLKIEEVKDEDEEDKDSMYDKGFSDYS